MATGLNAKESLKTPFKFNYRNHEAIIILMILCYDRIKFKCNLVYYSRLASRLSFGSIDRLRWPAACGSCQKRNSRYLNWLTDEHHQWWLRIIYQGIAQWRRLPEYIQCAGRTLSSQQSVHHCSMPVDRLKSFANACHWTSQDSSGIAFLRIKLFQILHQTL